MKHLFIFFIPLIMFAQNNYYPKLNVYDISKTYYNEVEKKNIVENKIILRTIMFEWGIYQKECYADSSLECFEMWAKPQNTFVDFSDQTVKNEIDTIYANCVERIDPFSSSNYLGVTEKWVHKEPSFLDFMNFLSHRLNNKK